MASSPEYAHGYDAGLNGPNTTNCHFSIFSSPARTAAWERGNRAGIAVREARNAAPPRQSGLGDTGAEAGEGQS